jgi:hypothetical protein
MKRTLENRPTTAGLVLFLAAFGAALLTPACSSDRSEHDELDGPTPTLSLFAVGDTGSPWGIAPQLFSGQLAVGRAMQREHARAPIDAFILLGDNFYPKGLLVDELLTRVVKNIARPYCAFIDPSPQLATLLGNDCSYVGQRPPDIFAVAGNHDFDSPGSQRLQLNEIPRLVRNWDMPVENAPAIRDLAGGLSLIFLNSGYPWGDPETRALRDALRRARGPWRIVVGHRPPIAGHPQLSRMVTRASDQSDRVVHAYLAGHVHVLGALRGVLPAPALTVIAGSGSHARRQDATEYRIEEADLIVEELGFVRVDLMPPTKAAPERLRITLLETQKSAVLALLGNTTRARYEISLEGDVDRVD